MTHLSALVEQRGYFVTALTEEEGTEKFDYLFIDEAGQVPLQTSWG